MYGYDPVEVLCGKLHCMLNLFFLSVVSSSHLLLEWNLWLVYLKV